MIRVTLNGEEQKFERGLTLGHLLAQFELEPGEVAVEHNRVIVPRSTLDDIIIQEGDEVEIVHFVGGG